MRGDSRPNVLLLIADSLRVDDAYGDATDTPKLDALAERGTRFDQAYATAPGTATSHAAMFSGQFPSNTGVVGQTQIPADATMVAETLRDTGYDTLGIAGPGRMGAKWGYGRGFEEYMETFAGDLPHYDELAFPRKLLGDATARRPMLRDFLRKIRKGPDKKTFYKFDYLAEAIQRDREAPFFGMMNTTLVHSPYDPPRPKKEAATPALDRPRWYVLEHFTDREETLDREDVRPERIYEAQTTTGIARFLADPEYLTQSELSVLRAWYRASIEYFDSQLGRFLDRLDDAGVLEDTVVVVTADHGEYFGEHGLIVHSHYLHDEVTHVPLIAAGPGIPTEERSDLVSHVDLHRTFANLAGVDAPPETDGSNLWNGEPRDAVFSEYGERHENRTGHRRFMTDEQLHEFGVGRKTVRTEEYRYVYRSDGEEALYRRPAWCEEQPVEDPDPEVLAEHRELVEQALGLDFRETDPDPEFDERVEEHLRELGYVE